MPSYAVVVPTKDRARYLQPLLEDLVRQDVEGASWSLTVIDDDPAESARPLATRVSAASGVPIAWRRREGLPGLNAGRNTAIAHTDEDVVVFVDDDVRVGPGWLGALDDAVRRWPEAECFAGEIRQSVDPGNLRWCGREPFPITALDLGSIDRPSDVAYGAQFAVRRSAIERIGGFEERIAIYGDEMDWVLRLRRADGMVVYAADWGLEHTRFAADTSPAGLLGQVRRRAPNVARFDRRLELSHPGLGRRTVGRAVHALRRGCVVGLADSFEALTLVRHGAGGPDALRALRRDG